MRVNLLSSTPPSDGGSSLSRLPTHGGLFTYVAAPFPDLLPVSPELQRFHESLRRLGGALSGTVKWCLSNGGAMHYYAGAVSIPRLPTDIDITVSGIALEGLLGLLTAMGIPAEYVSGPVVIGGIQYCEPQIKAELGGMKVDILTASRIRRRMEGGEFELRPDFGDSEFWIRTQTVLLHDGGIPVAPLEYLALVKLFLGRPHPKQDLYDLALMRHVTHRCREVFDIAFFESIRERWVRRVGD